MFNNVKFKIITRHVRLSENNCPNKRLETGRYSGFNPIKWIIPFWNDYCRQSLIKNFNIQIKIPRHAHKLNESCQVLLRKSFTNSEWWSVATLIDLSLNKAFFICLNMPSCSNLFRQIDWIRILAKSLTQNRNFKYIIHCLPYSLSQCLLGYCILYGLSLASTKNCGRYLNRRGKNVFFNILSFVVFFSSVPSCSSDDYVRSQFIANRE